MYKLHSNPRPHTETAAHSRGHSSAARNALLTIILTWAVVFLPWLGADGFSNTEGFRVAAGWSMLERGDWLRQEILGAPYLRKPPGIAWSIATSSAILGKNEFAARLPSALAILAMGLGAFAFVRRAITPHGIDLPHARPIIAPLAAGLAPILTPVLWEWGRAAEIEALCAAMTMLAALCTIQCVTSNAQPRGLRGILLTLGVALGLAGSLLYKGPAMLPVIGAALIGSAIAARTWRGIASPALWTGLLIGIILSALLFWLVAQRTITTGAMTQGPGEFLWDTSKLSQIATLPIAVLIGALPIALFVLVAFWRTRRHTAPRTHSTTITRALLWSIALCVATYWLMGVSNVRYALPVVVLMLPLVGAVVTVNQPRRLIAIAATLLIGSQVYMYLAHKSRAKNTGLTVGKMVADNAPDGSLILMDEAVEARPEFGLYAQRLARAQGKTITPHWNRTWIARLTRNDPSTANLPITPPPHTGPILLLTRANARNGEYDTLSSTTTNSPWHELSRATTHEFEMVLLSPTHLQKPLP